MRGGDPAEAPVFVDGARLFYPGRYETLNGASFGILDSQVLDAAYFSSGGFSARYGDALSGVLDVRTIGRPDTRTLRAERQHRAAGHQPRPAVVAQPGRVGTVRGPRTRG